MTDTTEQKALALVEECSEYGALYKNYREVPNSLFHKALCRAIEQHEAFRQEVSDALSVYQKADGVEERSRIWDALTRFIVTKPDPLVEVFYDVDTGPGWDSHEDYIRQIRAAIEKRGGKIVWGEG